jgi:hypothetical protein
VDALHGRYTAQHRPGAPLLSMVRFVRISCQLSILLLLPPGTSALGIGRHQ